MKCFAIQHSMNTKIVGKIPHTKEVIHNCDVWDEPRFIDRMFFKKIEGKPILSNAVLFPNAKLTDFIVTFGMGFSFGSMLISDKLKKILEGFNVLGLQYFKTFLILNNVKIENYWQTHNFKFAYEYIDFVGSEFYLKNSETRVIDYSKRLIFENSTEFEKFVNNREYPYSPIIKTIKFNTNMNLDYFTLRFFELGNGYGIVSEKLKEEIEKQGITGIEFRPIDIPLQDWLRSEEREKIYGKS